MNNLLIKCPHCNKIFKIIKSTKVKNLCLFITDFNDVFFPESDYRYKCLNCKENFNLVDNSITTEDWIADMLFKIKGS